jgi:5-hydroxyisourate hydrolase
MSCISTHVLDTSRGKPATGVAVTLERLINGDWGEVNHGVTDADGRIATLMPTGQQVVAGDYRLRFATGDYFRDLGQSVFYPEVNVHVRFDAPGGKYHLPLLLNPFGYSTYRGS